VVAVVSREPGGVLEKIVDDIGGIGRCREPGPHLGAGDPELDLHLVNPMQDAHGLLAK
jgi:hypothetical protein